MHLIEDNAIYFDNFSKIKKILFYSGSFGDFSIYSFNIMKNISSFYGGAATTNDQNFLKFYNQVSSMTEIVIKGDFKNNNSPQYLREFESFYDTWLMNKYIGGGLKNFRYYCHTRPNIDKNSNFVCNMHPHNYYLEILTETGLVGFIILVSAFLLILQSTFIKKYFSRSSKNYDNVIIPFIFLFFIEIFPIKSTGSFFTTGNTTYLFLIMGLLVGLIPKQNSIEKNR